MANRCLGVMPPKAMFGRSWLRVDGRRQAFDLHPKLGGLSVFLMAASLCDVRIPYPSGTLDLEQSLL